MLKCVPFDADFKLIGVECVTRRARVVVTTELEWMKS